MSIAIQRIKRAIQDMPTGGMQTGKKQIKLEYSDSQRAITEIEALQAERDALAAQVEMLQKHIERVALCYYNNTGNEPSLSVFHRALDEAESAVFKELQQCLAEIRAEAVEDAASYLRSLITAPPDLFGGAYMKLNKYAEQIRQGGAK